MNAQHFPHPLIDPGTPAHLVEAEIARKLDLQEQSHKTIKSLVAETDPDARRSLYRQLRQINDTLGIPTDAADVLLGQEGGAA
jgi:hypothetical protein